MIRVLIIDDEEAILETLQIGLTRLGYHVEIASSGLEGLRRFDEGAFDVVVTDINMPDVDGFGVARHIRESARAETPIVGISGMIQDLEFEEFDYVFPKPFMIQKLADSIEALMTRAGRVSQLPSSSLRDRRKAERIVVGGKADAVLTGPGFSRTVQIIDISRGGVAFRYVDGRKPLRGPLELNISWDHADLCLTDLEIRMVSDCEMDEDLILGAFPVKRCRAAFVQLTTDQSSGLRDFLGKREKDKNP